MTTGQRVAQKRKEQGLSQEALGERLGVSRQSIYKWESDSALPEIEKLVSLSRLFGVSVGWLLGVEEDPAPGGPELTEDQLKMVEEIASRYTSRPQLTPRRQAVVKISITAAALCLCAVLYGFYQRLEDLTQSYSELQVSIAHVQSGVNGQISGISNRVEEILKAQNEITADYGTALVNVDLSASSAAFQVYAVPKNYVEGMTAEFYEAGGSRSRVFAAKEEPGQRFEADLTCGLMEEITLSVTFLYPDGSRQTQLLDTYQGLYGQTFPQVNVSYDLERKAVKDGALVLPEGYGSAGNPYGTAGGWSNTAPAMNSVVPTAEAETLRVGLFKNQKLVDWAVFPVTPGAVEETDFLTGKQWEAVEGFGESLEGGGRLPQAVSFYFPAQEILLEPGDVIQVAAVVRDVYGRTAVQAGESYGLEAGWDRLTRQAAGAPDAYPGEWMLPDGSSISSQR